MSHLVTTLGPKHADELGLILPHEHIFVDLRTWDQPGYGEAETADVLRLMQPQIEAAQAVGVTALVECSTGGVGVRADIDRAVSTATQLPVIVPTGFYREPWIPDWVHVAEEAGLQAYMTAELQTQIGDTGVQAGWIKVSAGDDGITASETKVLRAAAKAAATVNAVIGSHTIRGRVVRDQLDIIEAAGYTADRFIWIHTQAEPDFALHLEMARRGAWLEYDAIGSSGFSDDFFIEHIHRVLAAGFGHKLLLSHDRGWYDPAQPGGGVPQPYTYLCEHFLPKLRASGVDEATVQQLTHTNPFNAFARD
ncbi:MAG: esterase [Ardenticatenaceae bacterium]|nr:esterase [Ardenticatenaceae bacterium]